MRRRILKSTVGLLLLLGVCFTLDYRAYPYGAAPGGRSFNRGENGLWLRYTWYFGQHPDAERWLLAQQFRTHQIRYAFFHVRSIGRDGRLAFRYAAQAKALTDGLHRDCPDVKVIAWAYVSEAPSEQVASLTNGRKRQAMIAEALWLVRDCGFDGVQWDVEPCPDGNTGFLALMRETQVALPPGKLLSAATPMWMPAALRLSGWSDAYFTQVAATCDQIAVMCYDSGFYTPRSYVWLVRQQAVHVTQAVGQGNPKCRVLLGVPTYGTGLPSHNPHAENLTMALHGVREGLAEPTADPSVFAGIAPFADYTTSAKDWKTYETLWLTPSPPRP